ncbi:MAG TPA: hypothetical protein VFV38_17135 [Ktedonobacteraceae bacterium]|nr:hypothetical protein [Ktedonobacteraceae bacterium]
MNHQRFHQQHHPRQHGTTRSQSTQYRAQSRKEQLERELRHLERDVASLDAHIDALGHKGRLLEAEKNAHLASIPFAIAQVALSTLGVRYLPPVARSWHYKHQQVLRAEANLKQYAVTLYTRREALIAQIEMLHVQIDLLPFEP